MKKNQLKMMGILMMIVSSCHLNEEPVPESFIQRLPISQEAINQQVLEILHQKNEFRWEWVSDHTLSSALIQTDSILTVGYQPAGYPNLKDQIDRINLKNPQWIEARKIIIDRIREVYEDLGIRASVDDRITLVHEVLPYFKIKVYEEGVIHQIRTLEQVRYAEPQTFTFEEYSSDPSKRIQSSSGCSVSPDNAIPVSDYTTVSPSSKIPWNFDYHQIQTAWNTSTGEGITLGLIDTGVSPNQNMLNGSFNSGMSTGRSLTKYGTYVSSWWPWASPDGPNDQCGHGTQMAGLLSAPRGTAGTTSGVAFRSNLAAVRGTGDVIVNGGKEKDGVSDGLVILGNRPDVKIISMSIGDVFNSGQVEDAIQYAYNKGKMIVCAAGTSLDWTSWWGVIFPANLSQTIAVTGIKDNGYNKCNTCHNGEQVDFVVVMQRASDSDRTSLTLAPSGNQPARVGGSSAATATFSGIAALVWANPNQTRAQVLQRLQDAADFYPSRDSNFGWGKIDASLAVQ